MGKRGPKPGTKKSIEHIQKVAIALKGKNTKNRKPIEYNVTSTECWECTSHKKGTNGYFFVMRNRIMYPMHKFMYEQKYGIVPEGMLACHTCDNPSCINPDHIFIGSPADNTHDMIIKKRNSFGEKHPHTKFKETDIIAILKSEQTYEKIAANFGVTKSAISHIKNKRSWKHIMLPDQG
jgi:hypothetical protein